MLPPPPSLDRRLQKINRTRRGCRDRLHVVVRHIFGNWRAVFNRNQQNSCEPAQTYVALRVPLPDFLFPADASAWMYFFPRLW